MASSQILLGLECVSALAQGQQLIHLKLAYTAETGLPERWILRRSSAAFGPCSIAAKGYPQSIARSCAIVFPRSKSPSRWWIWAPTVLLRFQFMRQGKFIQVKSRIKVRQHHTPPEFCDGTFSPVRFGSEAGIASMPDLGNSRHYLVPGRLENWAGTNLVRQY
jgi:hypothetical protein